MKNMINKLFLLAVSAFVLVGCSQFKGSAPIPHLDLGIKVVDAEGNNLVGSAMYGDSVKVLPIKQYVSKDTCFHNGVIFVNIAPEKHDDKPTWVTTYIQWNSYDTDTVRAIFGRYGPYYTYDKVYYNDSLVFSSYKEWSSSDNPEYKGDYITIKK